MRQKNTAQALLALIVCIALVRPAAGEGTDDIPPLYYPVSGPISAPPGGTPPNGRVTVMLELEPTTDKSALLSNLAQLGGEALFETRLAYDGIAVSLPAKHLGKADALPGVDDVHIIPPKERANTQQVPSTAALAAWSLPPGLTGQGVRIGVIDSGIDYTHATFGGPGTAAAFDANNPAVIEPGTFPTPKVAGGTDFVGDAYDADGIFGSPTPSPDADPLDCRAAAGGRGGHGTHVASAAAGRGVVGGLPYEGPYDTPGVTFDVAPGVAPDATLYSFKIFGCRGTTTFLTRAIEYAIDPNGDGDYSDRLVDVLNISLGSPFGSADDPDALAVEQAVAAGVVVVASAGDSGNLFYSTSSPASASGAIAVGATSTAPGAAPLPGSLAEFSARGPQRGNGAGKPDLVAPGVDISAAAAGSGAAAVSLSGTSVASAQVAGAAALTLQRNRGWPPAAVKAALVNTATPLERVPGELYPISMSGAGLLDLSQLGNLPLIAVSADAPEAVGLSYGAPWIDQPLTITRDLLFYNPGEQAQVVALSATTAVSEAGVLLTLPESSVDVAPGGMARLPVTLSVDPTALDNTIDNATPILQGIFDRYYLAEHSGIVTIASADFARVRAAHGAAFGAIAFYLDDQPLSPLLARSQFTDYRPAAPGRRTVSVLPRDAVFGTVEPIVSREFELRENSDYTFMLVGGGTVLYLIVVETPRITPSEAAVQYVNANMAGPVDIYVDGALEVEGLEYTASTGLAGISAGTHLVEFYPAGANPARTTPIATGTISPAAGHVLLVGAAERGLDDDCGGNASCRAERRLIVGVGWDEPFPPIAIRVPFQFFPKAASNARATATSLPIAPGQTFFSIGLENTGARDEATSPHGAQSSLVSAFELAASSPPIADLPASARAGDLRHVGITSSYSVTQAIDSTTLYFGIASQGAWSTPHEVQFRTYIDSTGPLGVPDGVDDFAIVSTSFGVVATGAANDVFVSLLYRVLPDGSLEWTGQPPARWNSLPSPNGTPFLDPAPYNSEVMFQLASARALGLTAAGSTFRYHVETRLRDRGNFTQVVDRAPETGKLTYNILQPAVAPMNGARGVPNLQQRPVFIDRTGSQISGWVNPLVLAARGQQDILVFHHHNPVGSQAEVVTLTAGP